MKRSGEPVMAHSPDQTPDSDENFIKSHVEWITAKHALERLCIRRHTFYSYVSRGRIRAKSDPDDPRKNLYNGPDVERIAQQPRAARRRALSYALSNHGGAPPSLYAVLAAPSDRSAHLGPQFLTMWRRLGLEEAAQWLWSAQPDVFAGELKIAPALFGDGSANIREFLARRSKSDLSPLRRPTADLHREGAALIKGMAQAIACVPARPDEPIHMQLARGWRAPDAAEPLRKALLLLVNKTLNAPSLAARIAAASGAPLAGCMLSGLTKLKTTPSGKEFRHVARLVQKASWSDLIAEVGDWPTDVNPLPGFSASTSPEFDARAIELLDSFKPTVTYQSYCDLIRCSRGLTPNIHFALAALVARFDLPADAPLLILVLARSPGWIAHALEEASDRTVGAAPVVAN